MFTLINNQKKRPSGSDTLRPRRCRPSRERQIRVSGNLFRQNLRYRVGGGDGFSL